MTPKRLLRNWGDIRRDWPLLTAYQRFETAVALFLQVVISAVILVALFRLIVGVIDTLVLRMTACDELQAHPDWLTRRAG